MSTINTLFSFLLGHLMYTGYQISRIPPAIFSKSFYKPPIDLFTFLLSRWFQYLQHIQAVRGCIDK